MDKLNRREFLKLNAAAIAFSFLPGGCRRWHRKPNPNVVVVLIDTLRPDYLGFYGYKKEMAPFLAGISKKSVVFSRAFSTSSWTAPSTASLFTSMYPHQHGIVEGFIANKRQVEKLKRTGKATIQLNSLPKDVSTLPEIFKSMGYTTFGLATNINIGNEIGFDRGFDQFERHSQAPAFSAYNWVKKWEEEIKKSKPFFLYLHLNDVHKPYHRRQRYYEKQNDPRQDAQARYLSEIGYVDEYIGKIYETLSLADDTIFLVISDHGEEFWEHGGNGHLAKMYRELTQVLMFFHAPFLGLKPMRVNINVSLIDVLPTLIELTNGNPLQGAEGISLLPLMKTDGLIAKITEFQNRILFAHRIEDAITSPDYHWSQANPELQHWAAIYRHWNLIERWDDQKELYNHKVDLQEKNNVFLEYPEISSQLLTALQKFKKQAQKQSTEKTTTDLDEKLLETLKSLGYVK